MLLSLVPGNYRPTSPSCAFMCPSLPCRSVLSTLASHARRHPGHHKPHLLLRPVPAHRLQPSPLPVVSVPPTQSCLTHTHVALKPSPDLYTHTHLQVARACAPHGQLKGCMHVLPQRISQSVQRGDFGLMQLFCLVCGAAAELNIALALGSLPPAFCLHEGRCALCKCESPIACSKEGAASLWRTTRAAGWVCD